MRACVQTLNQLTKPLQHIEKYNFLLVKGLCLTLNHTLNTINQLRLGYSLLAIQQKI